MYCCVSMLLAISRGFRPLCPPYASVERCLYATTCPGKHWVGIWICKARGKGGPWERAMKVYILCNNKMHVLLRIHILLNPFTTSDHCRRNLRGTRSGSEQIRTFIRKQNFVLSEPIRFHRSFTKLMVDVGGKRRKISFLIPQLGRRNPKIFPDCVWHGAAGNIDDDLAFYVNHTRSLGKFWMWYNSFIKSSAIGTLHSTTSFLHVSRTPTKSSWLRGLAHATVGL